MPTEFDDAISRWARADVAAAGTQADSPEGTEARIERDHARADVLRLTDRSPRPSAIDHPGRRLGAAIVHARRIQAVSRPSTGG